MNKNIRKKKNKKKQTDILEDEYNRYPYESFPFPQSHPAHLYTIAKLFKLDPIPIEKARILELGCASGGNLIPIAFSFPEATFLGIDLSDKEIQEGNHHIQALALRNITLRHQSILDFNASEGAFDYIICHGVYSWVTTPVREKIFNICQHNLSKNGIAYISYNTFPGWNTVKNVRDLMLWHTKNIDDPVEKAKNSRTIMRFITDGLKDDPSPYATFLKNEIDIISKYADSYLLHDHLSTYNDPTYFYQFMEKANAYQLSYLADASLTTMFTDNLPPVFSKELKKINNIIISEQYMDFIRNQRFRSTLLCHQKVTIDRALKTNDIENFYLKFLGKSEKQDLNESDIGKNTNLVFSNGNVNLTVSHPLLQWAMYILYQNGDNFIHYNTLCDEIAKRSGTHDLPLIKQKINNELNLMRAVLAGLIQISFYPPTYTSAVSDKPMACPFVQYQLSSKQSFVTNRRHQPIQLDPLGHILLPYVDGQHDLMFFENILINEIKKGTLTLLDKDKNPIKEEETMKKLSATFCLKALAQFAKQGLLIPTPTSH